MELLRVGLCGEFVELGEESGSDGIAGCVMIGAAVDGAGVGGVAIPCAAEHECLLFVSSCAFVAVPAGAAESEHFGLPPSPMHALDGVGVFACG